MNEKNNPAAAAAADPSAADEIARRAFLERLSLLLGGAGALVVAMPVAGFVFAPLFLQTPAVWRSVGPVDKFKVGETVSVAFEDASPLPWAGVTAKTAAWLRRESGENFVAFAITCTHLGCPVRWRQEAGLFMCPCHGGVYYQDGSVAAGPPPRPLTRFAVRVSNGAVEIQPQPISISKFGQ